MKPIVTITQTPDGKEMIIEARLTAAADTPDALWDKVESFLAAIELMSKDEQDSKAIEA